jgi:uncharacterized protein (DUF2267 family)
MLFPAMIKKIIMAINTGKYVEEVNHFLRQVATELGNPEDTDHAGRVTIAVLHTLRERISVEESIHLISQLPIILKGIYVDGWDISREMSEADTLDEFLEGIRQNAPRTQARDFGNDQEAREKVKAILRVMRNYISTGEMNHIREQLPDRLGVLFEE